jgi:hypothetical protein
MLSCRDLTERAGDYLEGAMPPRARLGVWLHLLICRVCRLYLRQLRLIARVIGGLRRELPPEEVERQVERLRRM